MYTRIFYRLPVKEPGSRGIKVPRWPKCTAGFDRDWPHIIHATLLWQQPHPIYFAELDYRLHPTAETLEKWRDVVFETADFHGRLCPLRQAEESLCIRTSGIYRFRRIQILCKRLIRLLN